MKKSELFMKQPNKREIHFAFIQFQSVGGRPMGGNADRLAQMVLEAFDEPVQRDLVNLVRQMVHGHRFELVLLENERAECNAANKFIVVRK